MCWTVWNGHLHIFANDKFSEDFKTLEQMEYEHNTCGIALWLLWARWVVVVVVVVVVIVVVIDENTVLL